MERPALGIYKHIHTITGTFMLAAKQCPLISPHEPTHASEYEALQVPLGKEMLVPELINSGDKQRSSGVDPREQWWVDEWEANMVFNSILTFHISSVCILFAGSTYFYENEFKKQGLGQLFIVKFSHRQTAKNCHVAPFALARKSDGKFWECSNAGSDHE